MLRLAIAAAFGLVAALATPSAPLAETKTATSSRPKIVVLVSATSPAGTTTSFGSTGTDQVAAAIAISRALVARGFDVVSAAGQQVSRVAGSEEADAPVLADASAADFARRLGAGAAVIVGVGSKVEGPIRGTLQLGAVATGQARLLSVADARVLVSRDASGAGFGADGEAAAQRAISDAVDELVGALTDGATAAWPAPLKTAGNRMTIRIRGARTWAPVSSVIRRLATTKGINAVHPREVKGSVVTLGVDTSLAAGSVVKAIRGTRLLSGTLSAKQDGSELRVVVRGD